VSASATTPPGPTSGLGSRCTDRRAAKRACISSRESFASGATPSIHVWRRRPAVECRVAVGRGPASASRPGDDAAVERRIAVRRRAVRRLRVVVLFRVGRCVFARRRSATRGSGDRGSEDAIACAPARLSRERFADRAAAERTRRAKMCEAPAPPTYAQAHGRDSSSV
jgi:hypothetical protein